MAALAVLLLAACGGGGGGEPSPAPPAPPVTPAPPETPALSVVGTSPGAGATAVEPSTSISVTYSTTLANVPGFVVAAGGNPVAGTASANGAVATFTPGQPLPRGSAISVSVSGGVGTAGEQQASAHNWTFATDARPLLVLQAGTVAFVAATGGADPPAQAVQIGSDGGGVGDLTVGEVTYGAGGSGWLLGGVTLDGQSTPSTLRLAPKIAGLPSGRYTASVPVSSGTAGNSPLTIVVTLTVNDEPPALGLARTELAFNAAPGGGSPAAQTVSIANTGGGTLSGLSVGTIGYGAGASGWLGTPTLSATTAPAIMSLQPSAAGLAAGTYTATVPVLSANGSNGARSVAVTLIVSAAPPALVVTPAGRSFTATAGGADPATQTVQIGNSGGGTLGGLSVGAIAYGPGASGWLGAGTVLDTTTSPATLTLSPKIAGLSAGAYTATVPIVSSTAANSPQAVQVTLTLGEPTPRILLSAGNVGFNAVSLAANPVGQGVTITNSGGGTLSGLAVGAVSYGSGASGWLGAPTLSATTAPATLNLQPSVVGLAPGTYTATVPVLAGNGSNSPQGVTVTLNVAAAPSIVLSPAGRSFTATAGGADPAAQVVQVTSVEGTVGGLGVGPVSYGTAGASWLAGGVALDTATTPATLTLSPRIAGLVSGTYIASVPIVSGLAANSPQSVQVTLTINEPPRIQLAAGSAVFAAVSGGPNPTAQAVQITNTGGGTLAGLSVGTIAYGAGASGWLGTPTLNTTTAPATLSLQPSIAGLPVGTYTATVPVLAAGAANSPQSVTVTLAVSAPPALLLTPSSRTFAAVPGGANPALQTVAISNSGSGTLSGLSVGTISYGGGASGWLGTPALSAATAPATLNLQPSISGLAAGTYTATVPVLSSNGSNGPQNVSVTLIVSTAPAISLTSTSSTFVATVGGTNPSAASLQVTNGGGGTLSGLSVGTISYGAGASGWLGTPTLSGTAAPATLSLQPSIAGLAPGTYTATVPVLAGNGSNSPQNVSVTLTVTAAPSMALSPSSRSFTATAGGANPAAQAVQISNSGGGTLSGLSVGTISYGAGATGWLGTPTLSGTTAPAALNLQPSIAGLAAGTYTATVPVLAGNGSNSPQNVSVTLTVTAAPSMALSPASRSFAVTAGGANPAAQAVQISNSGGGTLSGLSVGTISYGAGATGWLGTPTLSGTTAPATLSLQPSIAGLAAGTYTATVPVLAGNGSNSPQNVSVTLTVAAAPSMALSPSSRSFAATAGGANPAAQSVSINNSGGGTLSGLSVGTISYGAGATAWLGTPTLSGTTAPATLSLQPIIAGLAAGTYTATVPVLASNGANGPQNVSVTLNVGAAQAASVRGRVVYARVPVAGNGGLNYAGTVDSPVRGATVQVLRADSGAVLASAATDAGGNYDMTLPQPLEVIVRVRAELKGTAGAASWDVTVRDNTAGDALYVMDSDVVSAANGVTQVDLRAGSGWSGSGYGAPRTAAPFAVLDVAYTGLQKVLSVAPATVFPALQMMWSVNNRPVSGDLAQGFIGDTFYLFANGQHRLYLLGLADTDTDEYDRHLIAHEFGHFLHRGLSRNDSIGGAHEFDSLLDMRVAFSEGWANGFSGIALADPYYSDSMGVAQAQGFRFDMSALQGANRGWFNEQSVMWTLWHLNASAGIGFQPLWQVLTGLPASLVADGSLATVHQYMHRLKQVVPAAAGTIDGLLAQQQITVTDALGSGETNDGGVPLALPLYKTHAAVSGVAQNFCVTDAAAGGSAQFNRLGAQTFIRFTLPTSGLRTVAVTSTNGATPSNPDFVLVRPDGSQTQLSGAGSTQSVGTSLAAGTYVLVVYDFELTHAADPLAQSGTRCFNVTITNR